MPNALDFVTHQSGIPYNPLNTIRVDPLQFLSADPYAQITDAIIFGAVNQLLGWIDQSTGLDLKDIAAPLEALLGTNTGLLSGFVNFVSGGLNPSTTANGGTLLSQLISSAGGSGNTLSDWTNLFSGTAGLSWVDYVLSLFGISGGTPTLATTLGTNLMSMLGNPLLNPGGVFNPVIAAENMVSSVLLPTNLLTPFASFQQLIDGVVGGSGNPLSTLINDLSYGIGTIDPLRLAHVPLSAIGNGFGSTTGQTPNLVTNGAFNTANSVIANNSNWSWDGTKDHTGTTGSGSAKVVANGTPLVLMSNAIAVSQGQTLNISGVTQWASLVSTGNPIWIGVQTFLNGGLVGNSVIQAITTPGANNSVWQTLSGTYQVPGGVDTVRVTINVGSTATSGSVWFDDLSAVKTGLLSGSWMNGISGTVASDLQSIVDQFFNFANGGSVFGNPLSGITTSLQTAFGGLAVAVLDNGNGTATPLISGVTDLFNGTASYGPLLGTNPLAGSIFDTGAGVAMTSNTMMQNLFGLAGTVSGLETRLQTVIDAVNQAASGTFIFGKNAETDYSALTQLPYANVSGPAGIIDIGTALQNTWDQLMQATTNSASSNTLLSELTSALQSALSNGNTALTNSTSNTNTLLIRNNQPLLSGLEATTESPFDVRHAVSSGTTMTATSTASPMSFLRVGQSANKGYFQILAQVSGTVTSLIFNIYKMDGSGNLNNVHTTSNLSSQLNGTSWAWLTESIATANQFATSPGDVLAYEPIVTGSGTVTLPSQTITAIPAHPTATPKQYAASRNPGTLGASPSQITAANIGYGGNQSWWGIGISNLPVGYQPPDKAKYSTNGTYTYTLPSWFRSGVDYLDVIALGPGGGGDSGWGGAGSIGTNTTVTVGGTTLTAAAGAAGNDGGSFSTGNYTGQSPGDQIYQGTLYPGGSTVSLGNGSPPGGGGAGGSWGSARGMGAFAGSWATATYQPTVTSISITVGVGGRGQTTFAAGNGADGSVWIVARQA